MKDKTMNATAKYVPTIKQLVGQVFAYVVLDRDLGEVDCFLDADGEFGALQNAKIYADQDEANNAALRLGVSFCRMKMELI